MLPLQSGIYGRRFSTNNAARCRVYEGRIGYDGLLGIAKAWKPRYFEHIELLNSL
jgi:hypothetical protein